MRHEHVRDRARDRVGGLMAVTQWEVITAGAVDGAPVLMPGVVVNGAGAGTAPGPTSGRGYPRT